MKTIISSAKCWFKHSQSYFAEIIPKNCIRLMAICVALLCILSGIVVTHADVAKWLLEDALDHSIVFGDDYHYMSSDDAPPPSNNTYHLTMPMMLQDYFNADIYSQFDNGLKMSLETDFIRPEKIKMWDDEEKEQAGDDFSQFVTDRPPKATR